MDDLSVWFETCEQQIALFQFVMPMVMENLTIIQHWYTLCYAVIQGNGHRLWVCRFKLKIIYLQQTSPIMLNVTMGQACKTLGQKWWWKQLGKKNLLMQWDVVACTQNIPQ